MPLLPDFVTVEKVRCSECGEYRIATPSGAVCPNVHGKIHLGIKESHIKELRRQIEEQQKWDQWRMSLPHALPVGKRVVMVDGELFRRSRQVYRMKQVKPGRQYVRYETGVYLVTPVVSKWLSGS